MTAIILALAGLAGCGSAPPKRGMIFSPNGEPLSGGPLGQHDCVTALGAWFDRLAANPPAQAGIDRARFLADAKRQFQRMDLDKTGILTPSVLARYRAPYAFAPGGYGGESARDEGEPSVRSARSQGYGGHRGRGQSDLNDENQGDSHKHATHDMSDDQPDPVMAADRDMRNEVTLPAFLANARENFADLDRNRDGVLSRDEVAASCPDQ